MLNFHNISLNSSRLVPIVVVLNATRAIFKPKPPPAPAPPKQNPPRKKFLLFLEMKLSSSNIKKFSQKIDFLKKIHTEKFSYISGNGNAEKVLRFSQKKADPMFKETFSILGKGTFLYSRKEYSEPCQ